MRPPIAPAHAAGTRFHPRGVVPALAFLLALGFVAGFVAQYLWMAPERYHQFWPRRWWLFVHLASGTVALLLAPLQYWLGVTRRWLPLHRRLGRSYLAAILVSSVAAVGLALQNDVSWLYGLGLLLLAVAWLTTSGMAWIAIRRRHIEQHREWMIRSAVVTFGFVWFRAILGTTIGFDIGTEAERFTAAAWGCWSVPLLITEVWLQRRKLT
jgi:hypothetical protein